MNSSKVDSRKFNKDLKELMTPYSQTLSTYMDGVKIMSADNDDCLKPTALCFRDMLKGGKIRVIKGTIKPARGFDAVLKRSEK